MILKKIYKLEKKHATNRITTETIAYFEQKAKKFPSTKKKKKSTKKKNLDSGFLYAYVPNPTDEEVFILNTTDLKQIYVTDATAVLFQKDFS